jgi:4-amino-4-deoxychorismate lyase
MKKGAEVLGIPFPGKNAIKDGLETAILESKICDAYVKICLLSHGMSIFYENPQRSSFLIIVRDYQPPKEPINACITSFRRSSTSPIPRLKSLNYLENILARREAMGLGFDEAIFLNDKGELCESSACNIFWLKEGTLFTPSPECGLLPGVIRSVLIELAREIDMDVVEGRFDSDKLISSTGGFLTNSLIGAIAIARLDQFELPILHQFKVIKSALMKKLGWD